jgi:NAD(P)H-flavin reductase
MSASAYLPRLMRISSQRDETSDVRTLRLDQVHPAPLSWRAGQFGLFSVFGQGESAFTIANPPTRGDHIECTFREMGKVTTGLRRLSIGQVIGFRGPYGNSFPVEEWRSKDLIFVGGGIGMAALHAPLRYVLDNRNDYGEVVILNGARGVADLVYAEEMKEWASIRGIQVVRTVDPGGEAPGWDGEIGLIPHVFERLGPRPDNAVAIICGPPVMLRFMLQSLDRLGFRPGQIVTTLENRMKCGFGHCGRCNIGPFYVCRDGPVITAAELKLLPPEV